MWTRKVLLSPSFLYDHTSLQVGSAASLATRPNQIVYWTRTACHNSKRTSRRIIIDRMMQRESRGSVRSGVHRAPVRDIFDQVFDCVVTFKRDGFLNRFARNVER